MRSTLLCLSASLALCLLLALGGLPQPALALPVAPTPGSVTIGPGGLVVDGKPFKIKGVAYSPVPVGESVHFAPFGDYFTPDYVYLWARDFPALRAMGVNTLRIYGWDQKVDHTPFLNACVQYGLKVVLTHFVGSTVDTPVSTAAQRQEAIDKFVAHVAVTGDHPAILMWSFGNELNGHWNGFKSAFDLANNCAWERPVACENLLDGPGTPCHAAQTCVYTPFFSWINDALGAVKKVTTRPVTSTFADVDRIVGTNPAVDRLPRFQHLLTNLDFVTVQLYRGWTFGDYFNQYKAETSKPLLVGEYGVDAYNDPCGWPENYQTMRPCFNYYGQPNALGGVSAEGYKGCSNAPASHPCHRPGDAVQFEWDQLLAKEINAASVVIGGILMSWHDEYWKNIGTEGFCVTPCPNGKEAECADPTTALHASLKLGGSAGCNYKAHVTCSNYNTGIHDLCGYYLGAAPDHYVNEAWFGLNGVTDCAVGDEHGGHKMSALQPRSVVSGMTNVFGGSGGHTALTCAQLQPCWTCSRMKSQQQILEGACNSQCGMEFDEPPVVVPEPEPEPVDPIPEEPVDPTPDPKDPAPADPTPEPVDPTPADPTTPDNGDGTPVDPSNPGDKPAPPPKTDTQNGAVRSDAARTHAPSILLLGSMLLSALMTRH